MSLPDGDWTEDSEVREQFAPELIARLEQLAREYLEE